MALAPSSTTRVAFVAESAFGTTPATPAFQVFRRTNGNLRLKKTTQVSGEMQADGNERDEFMTALDITGSYSFEMSYGTLDPLLEAVCRSSFSSDVLVNGITPKSFTFEETLYPGGVAAYLRYLGCAVSQLTLNIQSRQSVTGTATLMGQKQVDDSAIIMGATYTAANTKAIQCGQNVGGLTFGGLTTTPRVKSLTLNLGANLRIRDEVGSLYTDEFGIGPMDVTGSFDAYFEDDELYQQVIAHGLLPISFTIGSITGEKYTIEIPAARLLDGGHQIGGKTNDVMYTIPFRGIYDATTGGSIKITRAVA